MKFDGIIDVNEFRSRNIFKYVMMKKFVQITFFVPLAPGATSSCSTNMGGETASFVFIIGTMFKLINSDSVQKRFFRVFSL